MCKFAINWTASLRRRTVLRRQAQYIPDTVTPYIIRQMEYGILDKIHFGVSFINISNSSLLQLMILCIFLNYRDCIFSRNVWYDCWIIFDHSSSEMWPVAVAFHLVMPARFLYLYLTNCLYNVLVSGSQRGTILPPRLTVPDLMRIHEIVVAIVFFFNLVVVKKVTNSLNNVMYLDDAFRSPVGQ